MSAPLLSWLVSATSTMGGVTRTLTYQYDANGNRTRITHPDGNYFRTDYDGLNRPTYLFANGAGLIGIYYTPHGALWEMDRANSIQWGYTAAQLGYDGIQRLASVSYDLTGTTAEGSVTLGRNPAGQIASAVGTNDAFAWTGHYAVNRGYTTNGLNQYTAAGSASFAYDANGNLTSDGGNSYIYDIENRLVSASGAHNAVLTYDPLGRLWQVTNTATGAVTRFLYDGDALVAEYDGSDNLLRRHAHGPAPTCR